MAGRCGIEHKEVIAIAVHQVHNVGQRKHFIESCGRHIQQAFHHVAVESKFHPGL